LFPARQGEWSPERWRFGVGVRGCAIPEKNIAASQPGEAANFFSDATIVALTASHGLRFANLRLGVGVAGVDEGLAASVAVVPIAIGVAVFLAATISTNPAHGVFIGRLVLAGLCGAPPPIVGLGEFFGFDFFAGNLQQNFGGGFGVAFVLLGGALRVAFRCLGGDGVGFKKHQVLIHGKKPRLSRAAMWVVNLHQPSSR
jgi:hypothetical protein